MCSSSLENTFTSEVDMKTNRLHVFSFPRKVDTVADEAMEDVESTPIRFTQHQSDCDFKAIVLTGLMGNAQALSLAPFRLQSAGYDER